MKLAVVRFLLFVFVCFDVFNYVLSDTNDLNGSSLYTAAVGACGMLLGALV